MYVLANVEWCSLPSIICVVSDQLDPSRAFTTCHDCNKTFESKDGYVIKKSCTHTGDWKSKLQTLKCKHVSPHCFSCDRELYIIYITNVQKV